MIQAIQAVNQVDDEEDVLYSLALSESAKQEAQRKKIERLKKEKEEKLKRMKVYDDIIFDSSTVEKIHPKLYEVQVHHISEINQLL